MGEIRTYGLTGGCWLARVSRGAPGSTPPDFARPEDCCAREHLRAARLERQSGHGVAAPKSAAGHGPAAFDRHAAETPFPAPSSSSRTQQASGLSSVI